MALLACEPSAPAAPNIRERFARARAGDPDERALAIARALPTVLSREDILYLETMRWTRLPDGQEERILLDPTFRRAVVLAWELRSHPMARREPASFSFVGVAHAQEGCGPRVGAVARTVRSIFGSVGSLVGHCEDGTPGCLGLALAIVADDAIAREVSETLGGDEAVAECMPDATPGTDDDVDRGRDDCAHGGPCASEDEVPPEESPPDPTCPPLTPTECDGTCCTIGYACCSDGSCAWMGGCGGGMDAGTDIDSSSGGNDAGAPGADAGSADDAASAPDSGTPADAGPDAGLDDAGRDSGGDAGPIDCGTYSTDGGSPEPAACSCAGGAFCGGGEICLRVPFNSVCCPPTGYSVPGDDCATVTCPMGYSLAETGLVSDTPGGALHQWCVCVEGREFPITMTRSFPARFCVTGTRP